MAIKLSLEHLISSYIKSATNGRVLSTRQTRILVLIVIPIWITGLIVCGFMYKDAVKAIPKYKAIQEFKHSPFNHDYDDENPYGGHTHKDWYRDGETSHQCSFKSDFWDNLGLNSPNHMDQVSGLIAIAESRQKSTLYNFYSLPIFFGLFMILPWIILKLIFWVIDADKNKVTEIKT